MDAHRLVPGDVTPASKKLGSGDAAALVAKASKVIVAKGKATKTFEVSDTPVDEIVAAMLGPTGNLRAPTLRVGDTLLVGFNEAEYVALFG